MADDEALGEEMAQSVASAEQQQQQQLTEASQSNSIAPLTFEEVRDEAEYRFGPLWVYFAMQRIEEGDPDPGERMLEGEYYTSMFELYHDQSQRPQWLSRARECG